MSVRRLLNAVSANEMTSASDTEPGDVVLVTGGAGFLGQHIIRVLQERGDDVREIRVLDRIPYENKLSTQNVCNEFWLNNIIIV